MCKLLIPLLAALALPTAVNAESYWLIIGDMSGDALEKIEMQDMNQCEEQGKIFKKSKFLKYPAKYICLTGK